MIQGLSIKLLNSMAGLVYVVGSALTIVGCQTQATEQLCQTQAYVIDQDPSGLNVRTEPNSESKVIGTLPLYTEVDVVNYQGNWLLVSAIDPELQGVEFQEEGWVYASLMGLNVRGYGSGSVSLYAEPDTTSKELGQVASSSAVTFVSCDGEWVKVRQKVRQDILEGWLEPDQQCAAALTSCS